jgi:transketolase
LDAFAETAADRRPSITRLTGALHAAMATPEPHPLVLPLSLLFARHLRFDSADPGWADRDRLLLAADLAPLGAALTRLACLPAEACHALGTPLGIGIGLVLAERLLAARFGRSLVDHRSWVFANGADLATGPMQEAAVLAGLWRLGRLAVIVSVPEADTPGLAGFAAAGWSVRRVPAGEAGDVAAAISAALRSQKPTLIACLPSTDPPLPHARAEGGEAAQAWANTGRRNAGMRRAWLKRLARHTSRLDFEAAISGRLPPGWHRALFEAGPLLPPGQTSISTAETLRLAWTRLAGSLPDLTSLPGSSGWKQPGAQTEFCHARAQAGCLAQGIGAAMAGMALHGGFLPVAAHCLSDLDHLWPGLRAAASSGLHFVECLVEPAGPAPAGHRASLRAMPNLLLFRPADASEALECAELALRRGTGPSVLLLSEHPVPLLAERPARTRCAKGGYILQEPAAPRAVTLVASGPELHVAIKARMLLAARAIPAAVVSMPCWAYFSRQDPQWQQAVLGDAPIVALEAGSGFGWERWLGPYGLFIGADPLAYETDTSASTLCAHRVADLVLRHLGIPPMA